jgi:hypothetical protein
MASLTLEQMEFLAAKGLSLSDAIEFAKLGNKKSNGAERQARYRARRRGGNVTSDVTRDASPPPIERIHTPSVSSDEETIPPAKSKSAIPAKPEGVNETTWQDFLALRKRKRAPVTETVIAGIAAEAKLAGWSLESALAKCVVRGWQSFEADWVKAEKPPNAAAGNEFLAHLTAKKQREQQSQPPN